MLLCHFISYFSAEKKKKNIGKWKKNFQGKENIELGRRIPFWRRMEKSVVYESLPLHLQKGLLTTKNYLRISDFNLGFLFNSYQSLKFFFATYQFS